MFREGAGHSSPRLVAIRGGQEWLNGAQAPAVSVPRSIPSTGIADARDAQRQRRRERKLRRIDARRVKNVRKAETKRDLTLLAIERRPNRSHGVPSSHPPHDPQVGISIKRGASHLQPGPAVSASREARRSHRPRARSPRGRKPRAAVPEPDACLSHRGRRRETETTLSLQPPAVRQRPSPCALARIRVSSDSRTSDLPVRQAGERQRRTPAGQLAHRGTGRSARRRD